MKYGNIKRRYGTPQIFHVEHKESQMKQSIIAIVLLAFASGSHAASFDCKKAATPVEKSICAEGQISDLDSLLMLSYKKALANAADPKSLKSEQRAWLTYVRNKCQDNICLKRVYNERLSVLNSIKAEEQLAKSQWETYSCEYDDWKKGISLDGRCHMEDTEINGHHASILTWPSGNKVSVEFINHQGENNICRLNGEAAVAAVSTEPSRKWFTGFTLDLNQELHWEKSPISSQRFLKAEAKADEAKAKAKAAKKAAQSQWETYSCVYMDLKKGISLDGRCHMEETEINGHYASIFTWPSGNGCDLNLKQPQQKERQRDLFFAKTESIVELLKLMPVNLKCQQHPVVSSAYRQDKISVL